MGFRVEWDWLFYVLEKFNFWGNFIKWIQIMYKDMRSTVFTNGFMSPYFQITRGIRQGDALSALLYIIQSEPLSQCFRENDNIPGVTVEDEDGTCCQIKGCQYVDDSINMLASPSIIKYCFVFYTRLGSWQWIDSSHSIYLNGHLLGDFVHSWNVFHMLNNVRIFISCPAKGGS